MASNGTAPSGAAPPTGGTHAPLSRTAIAATTIPQRERPPPTTDLSAGTSLHLGDFAASPALSISQTRYLVETIMQSRRTAGKRFAETEVTMKMQAYLDTFSRFKDRAQLDELESLLIPFPQLEFFERAQLLSLCPGDHEEAKTLIPSIAEKISDDELQQLVQDIASARAR